MSPRSFGIAVLLHACLIGMALQQLGEPEHVRPQAVMSVTASVQVPSSMPQPQRSPAQARAWPVPELELPGDVPAPDQEIDPTPEPEPLQEPQPEFTEAPEPENHRPVIKRDWTPRTDVTEPVDAPAERVSQVSDENVTTTGKEGDRPRSGEFEGFPSPDNPPRILNPDWPESVRERYTGSIQVKVVVGTNGRALRVELVEGTRNKTWDDRMLETFKNADYIPGVHNGMVLITSHIFRVHFRRTR